MKDKKNQAPRSYPRQDGQHRDKNFSAVDNNTLEEQCHPRKVFLGGLAHKTTTQNLRDMLGRFGAIVDAVVLRWPDGRSRGFGYVTFADASAAASVLQEKHVLHGREVDVKRAVPGTNKLFIGGLPQNSSANELREHFEQFGVVSDAVVMIDPSTGRSRGFGFVCFLPGHEGATAVASALEQYDNHRIRGKWIEVKSAAPPHKLDAKARATPDKQVSEEISLADALLCKDPPPLSSSLAPDSKDLMEPQRIVSALGSPRKVEISSVAFDVRQAPPVPAASPEPAPFPLWTPTPWGAPYAAGYGAFSPPLGAPPLDSTKPFAMRGSEAIKQPPCLGASGLSASESLQHSLELFLRQTLQNKMDMGVNKGPPSVSTACSSASQMEMIASLSGEN